LGVVGPSGAGKSTLARVLVGIWPAAVGKVRLDGADIYLWNKQELGPSIGYLPQDVELFAGTVSENIARFGDIDSDKVVLAAKRAGVHEMILYLPQGYDTILGDGGAGLSGGQKQRLGLARAMYDDPSFIVLDEPNSNLDDVGEQALIVAVQDLRKRGKTIVMITHRASTIAVTNKLLVLKDGVAQMFGFTHEVLENLNKMNQQQQQQINQAKQAPAKPADNADQANKTATESKTTAQQANVNGSATKSNFTSNPLAQSNSQAAAAKTNGETLEAKQEIDASAKGKKSKKKTYAVNLDVADKELTQVLDD
jgi:ATP-binding cassette, subfamily C, bacterial exporter for protease/lipase